MTVHLKPVVSSNIASVGFDKEKSRLCIQFQAGKVYEYTGVPSETYVDLMTAESHGKAFNSLIRNGSFEFKQIELDEI